MKISGITRVRNCEDIIESTLDHFGNYCNNGIVVFDDNSTDKTAEIAENYDAVSKVIRNSKWRNDRLDEESRTRQVALDEARKLNPDWIVCFDSDERLDVDFESAKYLMRSPDVDAIFMRLFDSYITDQDFDIDVKYSEFHGFYGDKGNGYKIPYGDLDEYIKSFENREWFGPEYRNIGMFFRVTPHLRYWRPDQRIADFKGNARDFGFVKHYGKSISISEWERKCQYYSENFPENYKKKWTARIGKAIHKKSDFGHDLLLWQEAKKSGFLLDETKSTKSVND